MTEAALTVLFHMLGLRPERRKLDAYRNHYVAGPGHHAELALDELEKAGLIFRRETVPLFLRADDVVYHATDEGRRLAFREARARVPVLTRSQRRYRQWLEADPPMSFGNWLREGLYRYSEPR